MADIKVYTLDEVAEILKVTKRTLYNYVKAGKLPAVKMGKYWRVSGEPTGFYLYRHSNFRRKQTQGKPEQGISYSSARTHLLTTCQSKREVLNGLSKQCTRVPTL